MSILGNCFRRTIATDSIADPNGFLTEYLVGANSKTGVSVTQQTALRVVAVFACIRVGAETVGSLPLHVYERLPDGSKRRAPEHPLYPLLHDAPNPEMTSLEWREAKQGHVEGRGNGYSQIVFDGAGRIAELNHLEATRTRITRPVANGPIVYVYTRPDGTERKFPAEQILHVRCFGSNGLEGYSPIRQAREAIGISMAAEEHWARFFAQGTASNVGLEHPKQLSPQAHTNIQRSWTERTSGLANAHKPLIAEEGMKIVSLPVNLSELQFLETRGFQVSEICRLFRIFGHLIGDMQNMTAWGSGIEQLNLAFVIYCLLPRLVRWEQRINWQLFSKQERGRYFVEFSLDGLLRGDAKSRAEALQIWRRNGIIDGNGWADIESLNHFPGGDIRIVESNMVRLEDVGNRRLHPAKQARGPGEGIVVIDALKPVLSAALGRSLCHEAKALSALAKKSERDRRPALAQIYEEHRGHLAEQLAPIVDSLAALRGTKADSSLTMAIATRIASEHRRLAEEASTAGKLASLAENWETGRSEHLALATIKFLMDC